MWIVLAVVVLVAAVIFVVRRSRGDWSAASVEDSWEDSLEDDSADL